MSAVIPVQSSPIPEWVDVYDLDRYAREGVNHRALRWMREQAPVFWHEEPGGRGFWAITRYADIVRISKDPKTFSSWQGGTNIEDYAPRDLGLIRIMMLNMDPPQHVKFRRLVRRGFTPRMVRYIEPKARATARRLVDSIASQGTCEFVRSVAAEFPLLVLADLLGVPHEDRQQLFDWSNSLIGFDDPEYQTSIEGMREAAGNVWAYANQLAKRRQGTEGEDLVSVLMRGEVDGHRLTIGEFDGFFLLLAVAGNETTRNAISHSVLTLMEHPEARQQLVDDPSLIPDAIEELLRWVAPVMYFRRTATEDTELHGVKIAKGDKVVMFYHAANRDPRAFDEPERFDIRRQENDHLSFGAGEHFCLGSSLARLELRTILEELLTRIDDFELVRPIRRLRSNFINGVKEMQIRYTPELR